MPYKLFITAVLLFCFCSCNTGENKKNAPGSFDDQQQTEVALNKLQPKEVLQRYYKAIRQHDYATAYNLWASDGKASGKIFTEFSKGYKNTRDVAIVFIDSVEIGGAAGSVYATVPVRIEAVTVEGKQQMFFGEYILRKRNIGPNRDSYSWYIYSAKLRKVDE